MRARFAAGVLALVAVGGLAAAQSQLPPGHPPLSRPPAAGGVPALPPGSGTGPAALTWTDPRGWVKQTPASTMRRAQYRIPGPGGDGECVVFYFGPGQGGSADSNAARWAEQFRQPDGRPSTAVMKTRTLEVGGIAVLVTEVTGTYVAGMPGGPAGPERPNWMLLGAVAEGPDANWFFKATGPRATMEANRAAFEALVRSLRRAA